MLVNGSSFARSDDEWVWRSNSSHSQAWPDREISASPPGRLTPGEVIPFFLNFIEYEDGCAPEGVWMLSRNFFACARD